MDVNNGKAFVLVVDGVAQPFGVPGYAPNDYLTGIVQLCGPTAEQRTPEYNTGVKVAQHHPTLAPPVDPTSRSTPEPTPASTLEPPQVNP